MNAADPKIVNHCLFGLCAYGSTPLFLKLGDGELPIGLTEVVLVSVAAVTRLAR